tara:strand:- start:174 stop:578 length:405 start_codon:yes stop_codon:yes gene_type:complete
MATTYSIKYKNHCTPQEQISSGGRYYLDSDCGRKLTGIASITPTSTSYSSEADITTTATSISSDKDFIFIKNTGSADVVVAFNGDADTEYLTKLSNGEALSVELRGTDNNNVKVKTISDDPSGEESTIEYFWGT